MTRIPRELLQELEWKPGMEVPKREPPTQVALCPTYDIDDLLRGEPFEGRNLAAALRKAQDYANDDGFVLTMPELLQAKIAAGSDHQYWQEGNYVLTDEYVGPGPDGNPVVVVLHGGGLLIPKRIERAYEDGQSGPTKRNLMGKGRHEKGGGGHSRLHLTRLREPLRATRKTVM